MTFFRPEAVGVLRRWGLPAIFLGVAIVAFGYGGLHLSRGNWFGVLPVLLGAFAAFALYGLVENALLAWRARREGPGVVTIEEGRISYLSPFGGAIMARDNLIRIEIATTDEEGDGITWELTDETGQFVSIPGGAQGAERLVDTLGAMPGFDHSAVIRATRAAGASRREVWRR